MYTDDRWQVIDVRISKVSKSRGWNKYVYRRYTAAQQQAQRGSRGYPGLSGQSGYKTGAPNWSFVFDPAGRLCYYWSMVVSLAFLYNFWVIIYRFAFQEINGQ